MTVAALPSRITYLENGVSLAFAVPFRFLAGVLSVSRTLPSGSVLQLKEGVDFTVTGGETDAGGTLTLVSSVPGAKLYIRRATPRSQPVDYAVGDRFPAESHEGALDRGTMISQELGDQLADVESRALRVPTGETVNPLPAQASRASRFLAFDAQGRPIMSLGTGGDLGLRQDLASLGGAGLVWTADGRTVQDYIDSETLEIAVVSDTQPLDTPEQRAAMISFWEDVARENCHMTFMLGDLVDKGNEGPAAGVNWDDFFDAVYASGIDPTTLFYLGGNHDRSFTEITEEPTNRMLGNFYQRTRRPPVWALENGNNVFIFAGYHSINLAQNMAAIVFDQLEKLCFYYWKTHNIILHVHAPLFNSGLFNSTTAGFFNRPPSRWTALLETYPIDVVFAGHNATDIISADEATVVTYDTSTNGSGHVTHHILTGPHLEQRVPTPGFRYGSRKMTFTYGSLNLRVQMRDHDLGTFVPGKELNIPLRFPALFGKRMEEVGHTVSAFAPFTTATRRGAIGLTEGNATPYNPVDTRKLVDDIAWIEAFAGDLPSTAELLYKITLPGQQAADSEYDNNGNNVGGSLLFGGRRLNSDDFDKEAGFVIYGSNPDGTEREIMRPYPGGKHVTKGDVYFTSDKWPMWKATKTDSTPRQNDGYITGFGAAAYDDFLQFNPATGLITCVHPGVYSVDGFFNFAGGDDVDDLLTLSYRRNRGGTETSLDIIEVNLKKSGSTARQPVSLPPGMIGLLVGDTLGLHISGWASGSAVTIARVMFRGQLIRMG